MRNQETPQAQCPAITVGTDTRTIIEHRTARDLSQADLGELMGVTQVWVSRIESGNLTLNKQPRKHMELVFATLDARAETARNRAATLMPTSGVLAA